MLIESCLFAAAYIVWLIFRSPASASRLLIGSLAVLVPLATAAILVFRSLPQVPVHSQRAWRLLGFALVCWAAGNVVRTFYQAVLGAALPVFSLADVLEFCAYPLLFYALVLYPFENRYAPSRFRFLLDATVTSGVVAALGWMILPGISTGSRMVVSQIYPLADVILLMILVNMLLANRKARRTLFLWGIGILAFTVSDFAYSLYVTTGGYQAGGAESLGWVAGGLLFGLGAVIDADSGPEERERRPLFDIWVRIQNVLPIALVFVLFWFAIINWQLTGRLSLLGMGMCLVSALALIVRVGVRAGESELHKYWQLFSSLAEPAFICDGSGKIVLGNPALVKALGLEDENQLDGRPLTAIFDDQTLPADLLQRALRQDISLEAALRPHRTPYLLSLSPVFSEGRRVLIAGAAHDLSEQKRQQAAVQEAYDELQGVSRQLSELNAQLEQKVDERTRTLSEAYLQLEEQNKALQALDQLKSDFVSMVSHELRTPLTSLNGGLELLLGRERPASDRTALLMMKDEVQRLTRFVENILNLSALDAGRLDIRAGPVSLPKLVAHACLKFGSIPGADRIRVELPDHLPPVQADGGFLESVLNHLIDNALKYAPTGPVVVDAVRQRGRVRVRVADSGPGIPEEKRALLFQRFQRLDARDSQSVYGYGLGLYLSRRMLLAMHSDLAFEQPPQGGSRFYFDLKVAK